jgi:tetratricopeptide (TPR) repeat protein
LCRELLGDADVSVGEHLAVAGMASYELKDYEAAEEDFRSALAILRKRVAAIDSEIADLRIRLAACERLRRSGRHGAGLLPRLHQLDKRVMQLIGPAHAGKRAAALVEMHAVLLELLGDADPLVVDTLWEMANAYQSQGNLQAAHNSLARAVDGGVRCYGPGDWRVTELRRQQAALTKALRKGPGQDRLGSLAAPLLAKLDKQEKANDFHGVLETLGRLADLYRAEQADEELLAVMKLEGNILVDLGHYPQAERVFRKRLEEKERLRGTREHPDYADDLERLGTLCCFQGRPEGIEHLRAALAIRKRLLPNETIVPQAYALISAYNIFGLRRQAMATFFELLPHLRQIQRGRAVVQQVGELMQLGGIYIGLGDDKTAEACALRALSVAREYEEDSSPFSRPAPSVTRGDLLASALLARRSPNVEGSLPSELYLWSLAGLVSVFEYRGRSEKALLVEERKDRLAMRLYGPDNPIYGQGLQIRARLHQEMGQNEQAVALSKEAAGIRRRTMDWAFVASPRSEQLVLTRLYRDYLDDFLSIGVQADWSAEELYKEVLAWKSAVFASQRWINQARADPAMAHKVDEWVARTRDFVARAVSPAKADYTEAERQRAELEKLRAELEQQEHEMKRILARQPRVALEQRTAADIQNRLPPNAVFIDFMEYMYSTVSRKGEEFKYERRLAAFVLRLGRPVQRFDLCADPIEQAVVGWRIAIRAEDRRPPADPGAEGKGKAIPEKREREWADELRRRVWKRLAPALEGCDTAFVSPDSALTSFPLGALPGDRRRYLRDERRIVIVPAPRLLPETLPATGANVLTSSQARRAPDPSLLLMTTGKMAIPHYTPLPRASEVLDNAERPFRAAYPKARVHRLLGEEATKRAFQQHAPGNRIIVLMVHGFYDRPAAERAAVVQRLGPRFLSTGLKLPYLLAPEKRGEPALLPELFAGLVLADSRLTAAEVAQLDLSGTDLVVLVACQTALGVSVPGKGCSACNRLSTLLASAPWCLVSGKSPRKPRWT